MGSSDHVAYVQDYRLTGAPFKSTVPDNRTRPRIPVLHHRAEMTWSGWICPVVTLRGRPQQDRAALARAFIAKAVFQIVPGRCASAWTTGRYAVCAAGRYPRAAQRSDLLAGPELLRAAYTRRCRSSWSATCHATRRRSRGVVDAHARARNGPRRAVLSAADADRDLADLPQSCAVGTSATPRAIRNPGSATSCISTRPTVGFRSVVS